MLTLRSQNLDHIRCGTCLVRDVLSDAAAQVVEGEIISGGIKYLNPSSRIIRVRGRELVLTLNETSGSRRP